MNIIGEETKKYVLLVKTNESFAHQVSMSLTDGGYHPLLFSDFAEALTQVKILQPVMVVTDYGFGEEKAVTFCQQVRQLRGENVVIFLLLNQETVTERVVVLESQADDYLVKPYSVKEFLKLVGLYIKTEVVVQERLIFADLILYLNSRQVWRGDRQLDLTVKEFELLKYLMSHPGQVLTREAILEQVWGYDFRGESNVIEVYIRYLRLKIEAKSETRLIHTIRKVGYVLKNES
jgi:DNA-binding response OmpR family regulator